MHTRRTLRGDDAFDVFAGLVAWLLMMGVAVGVVAVGLVMNGFVLATLWGWFMVPFGLPSLGIAWAIGLSGIFQLASPLPAPTDDDKKTKHIINIFLRPWLILAGCYVAKQFM